MQTIYIDIANKGVLSTIYAKQGDVGRKFLVVLSDAGVPYSPPAGSVFSVWYEGDSGEGNYTDIGDVSAFSVNGNKVTVELVAQMLAVAGEGLLCLVVNGADGSQIASWNINYLVESVPGANSEEAKSYYTAFSKAVENLPYPDASLSTPGKAADAAATGAALARKAPAIESAEYPGCYYRTVNGVVEWINPPTISSVEYRTTERWNGKAVYKKLIDVGTLPNGVTKTFTNLITGYTGIVGYRLIGYSAGAIKDYTTESYFNTVHIGITINTNGDLSSYSGSVYLEYIKD